MWTRGTEQSGVLGPSPALPQLLLGGVGGCECHDQEHGLWPDCLDWNPAFATPQLCDLGQLTYLLPPQLPYPSIRKRFQELVGVDT